MLKAIFAGTTALTLIGGTVVYAQQAAPAQPGSTITQTRVRTADEYVTRTNARIAELKAELKLTPQQEKNWSLFEATVRDSAKQRAERFEQASKMHGLASGQAQGERAAATPEEVAGQKRLAAAVDPLFKSLDEGQKQKFTSLFRVDGEGRHFWFRGRGDRGQRS